MRLSDADIAVIRALVRTRFGQDSRIWLFGSRLDDNARGGDIDLYVEPRSLSENRLTYCGRAWTARFPVRSRQIERLFSSIARKIWLAQSRPRDGGRYPRTGS